jgi:hypothetical protein
MILAANKVDIIEEL